MAVDTGKSYKWFKKRPKHHWVWISGVVIFIVGIFLPISLLPSGYEWIKYGMMIAGPLISVIWYFSYASTVMPGD